MQFYKIGKRPRNIWTSAETSTALRKYNPINTICFLPIQIKKSPFNGLIVLAIIINNIFIMTTQNRKKYSKITYIKRIKLIQMVEEQHIGVSRAAKKLRIKVPTAKVILSSYRKKGKIFHKKIEKKIIIQQNSEPQMEIPQVEEVQNLFQVNNQIGANLNLCYYPPFYVYYPDLQYYAFNF